MDKGNSPYWDNIYTSKRTDELSWTEEVPATSLELIQGFGLPKTARIIDIGGGDSRLVDYLLEEGFQHITVLDISAKGLEKAKKRLGAKGQKVNWVVSDVTAFHPETTFDVWHDRAAFHFLTGKEQISRYAATAKKCVSGYLIIGTFSKAGPRKCSGLDIRQYSEEGLAAEFSDGFEKLRCRTEDHVTPFHTIQNFLFCSFKRIGSGAA